MDLPEERARANIDRLLTAAGWEVQDRSRTNLGATAGVAVREFPLATGEADYLLFVNRKAIGAVEAKPEGATLSGVEAQSGKYSVGLPAPVPAWRRPLPFLYESSGVETFFTDSLDRQPRSQRVFAFHRPETMAEWAVGQPSRLPREGRPPTSLSRVGFWIRPGETIRAGASIPNPGRPP
jgi:type I restriction enzyme R subunit